MLRGIGHLLIWFISTLVVFLYVIWNITPELFWELVIGACVVAIITYYARFEKKMIPVAIIGILLSTFIVYYFVI